MRRILLALILFTSFVPCRPAGAQPADLKDGDLVALVGSAFIEREGKKGYIETALTLAHPDRNVRFRNLGWSGDTVWGESRSYFGPPIDGYNNLINELKRLKPSVIIVSYGANESYAGAAGLQAFTDQLNHMLDDMTAVTPRLVLLSPLPVETLGPPLPDMTRQQQNVEMYAQRLREIAEARHLTYVDLIGPLLNADKSQPPLTYNEIHLTDSGYQRAAHVIAAALVPGTPPIDFAKHDDLRKLIIEKNDFYFHRYRPANTTYLFGFRKHEQGRNAVEIPQFDPLIDQKDKQIADLRAKESH